MALEQRQQVLLVQAELFRQQVAVPGKDSDALRARFPQPVAVGAGDIGGKVVAVVLDDAHFQPACPQQRDQFFQQRGLAAVMHTADGQHRRVF